MRSLAVILFIILSTVTALAQAKLSPGRRYRTIERLAPERLAAVAADREALRRSRRKVKLQHGLVDYRAILHAHAADSAHTGGSRAELLAAAKRTGVKVIMLTDHVRPPRDFIDDSWRGLREGVLFIPGSEGEGFLNYPSRSVIDHYLRKDQKSREDYVKMITANGGNIFLSHVEERYDWSTAGLDGLEIYNNHSDMKDEFEFVGWLRGALTNPERLKRLNSLLASYPLEVFGALQDYHAPTIAKWDRDLVERPLTGVAANDCHHNQVYEIRAVAADTIEISIIGDPPRRVTTAQAPAIASLLEGRRPGDLLSRIDLDPYESSLQFVTTHLLLPKQDGLTEAAVRQALRSGRAYVAHDWLGDPTGFAFVATAQRARRGVMGDRIELATGLRLRLATPLPGTIRLFHQGSKIAESYGYNLDQPIAKPGVYRAEIWLTIDGEERPWIYSNPIRVE
ncbi:MAG: PHP domain-containing protein [Acidobacteriota bacterium]